MRSAFAILILATATGCASTSAPARSPATNSVVTLRTPSYPDAGLVARNRGRLEVTVRSVERPTEVARLAVITIQGSGADSARRATLDSSGVARFDTLPPGTYHISARSLGRNSWSTSAPVTVGCRTDVEIYLSMSIIGIAPPPPMRGRSTITVCGPVP